MTVVLASPRFLFREEDSRSPEIPDRHPLIDEYSLASRLSYFLWSSMPDERAVPAGRREQAAGEPAASVDADAGRSRSQEFVRNFVGQWLQARDIRDACSINAAGRDLRRTSRPTPRRERRPARFRELNRKPPESSDRSGEEGTEGSPRARSSAGSAASASSS